MKKVLTILMAFAMAICQIPSVNALEGNDNVNISNILINENVISCEVDGKDFSYDLDKEIIQMGDTTVYLDTTIEYIAPDEQMTEEELLNYEKELIKQNFENIKNQNSGIATCSSNLDPQVPANAEYVVATTFSKSISKIVAEIDELASDISTITGVLSLLGKIPATSIINYITVGYGVAKSAFSKIDLTVTGTWKYNLERTTKAYPAGITTQICYRYAHAALNMNVSCTFGTKSINKTQSTKGGWWVSSKPY